jgi:hypothetical protein
MSKTYGYFNMSLRQFISEQEHSIILEGKMEDDLSSQIKNKILKDRNVKSRIIRTIPQERNEDDTEYAIRVGKESSNAILNMDATSKKTFRMLILDWWISGEINLKEDAHFINTDLKYYEKANATKKEFKTRSELAEFISNIKSNRGIVDVMFDYTFDIDHDDKQFTIYNIQEKDKREYISKLGQCTTWCISTDQMFGHYTLPYYLLVDKKEKKQYAIVPTGGQFKDSKQNDDNSEKKFEEFDKILDLRNNYFFKIHPKNVDIMDAYIYSGPKFENAPLDIKVAVSGIINLR